jgi:hypothetical protein
MFLSRRMPLYVSVLEYNNDHYYYLRQEVMFYLRLYIVCQDRMVWKPKLQSHKIEELCLMLNCTSPCTNPLCQLH